MAHRSANSAMRHLSGSQVCGDPEAAKLAEDLDGELGDQLALMAGTVEFDGARLP